MLSPQEGYLSQRAWCPIPEPRLYWTKDGGSSWTVVALPLPAGLTVETFIAQCDIEQNILLSSQTPLLVLSCSWPDEGSVERHYWYRSGDEGHTWVCGEYPGGWLHTLDSVGLVALDRTGYVSDEGGTNWTQRKTVNWDGQFIFIDEDNGWAVARVKEEIALMRTRDGGLTWSIIESRLLDP